MDMVLFVRFYKMYRYTRASTRWTRFSESLSRNRKTGRGNRENEIRISNGEMHGASLDGYSTLHRRVHPIDDPRLVYISEIESNFFFFFFFSIARMQF